MSEKRFERWNDHSCKVKDNQEDTFLNWEDIVNKLNEQQDTIQRLQDENLYSNFELKFVDDLKKLKDVFEICMILIDGAIANKDLELGYESVFQFERRIKKFNGD